MSEHHADALVLKPREQAAHGAPEKAKRDVALEARDDGKGAARLLQNYVDHVLHKEQNPPLTHIPLDRLTDQFHESSFEEKLESIELRSIPYKSQMSIQRSLIPHLSTAQKRRFVMITQRIKADDASLIQVKLSNEGIDDFVLCQLCSGMTYNTRLQGLILHGNSITDEGVKRLCAVLCCHPRFHTLWLSANKFSDIGVRHLSKLIVRNHNVKELNLSNRWPSQVWAQKEYELHPHVTYIGADYLAQSLRQNSQLTSLSLADQRIRDDGAILLFEALPVSVLRSLNLAANELTNRCCPSLRAVLSLNPILEKLVLSKNQLSDEGAIAIAHGLVSNALLKTLDLSDNAIGDKGMVVLSRVVERNSSLESLITVGNPSHDHRAELVAATRNNSVFARTAAWRRSILVELKSINEDQREIGQAAVVVSEESASRPSTVTGHPADRRTRPPPTSFAEMNVSPFRKTSRQSSMLVAGVEAHGRKGLTRSIFVGDDGPAGTASSPSARGPQPPSLLDAIAMAVSAVNGTAEDSLAPVETATSPPRPAPAAPLRTPPTPSAPPCPVPRSQDLGKRLGVPRIQHIGVRPVRTQVSDYGDSHEHVLYLRVATEADPPDARPTSLVRIGLDHRDERARVCAARQSAAYKKHKELRLQERPHAFQPVTAPPPVPQPFWQHWRKKMDLLYPKGIDHSRACASTHLDPVHLPGSPGKGAEREAEAEDGPGQAAGPLDSLPDVVHAAMDRQRRGADKRRGGQAGQRAVDAVDAVERIAAVGRGGSPGEGPGRGTTDAQAEEAVTAAQRAALQALYDANDVQSPWNRYVAYKEDALRPEAERRLGYFRHLGFTARSFTPGQVLAARRKERAIQLGLIQEASALPREQGGKADKARRTRGPGGEGSPQAVAAVAGCTSEEVPGKKAYESTKLVLSVAGANRLS